MPHRAFTGTHNLEVGGAPVGDVQMHDEHHETGGDGAATVAEIASVQARVTDMDTA